MPETAGERINISSHILPTAGSMVGLCTTLIGLVKLFETQNGPTRVDEYCGIVAVLFLASALASYASIRTSRLPRVSAVGERAADLCFIVGLIGLAAVSVFFAYEVI